MKNSGAEGVQSYFNVNYLRGICGGDGIHNDINTRLKLKDYDPYLYAVTKNIFGKRSTGSTHMSYYNNM
jgi:hypothetical protein